MRHAAINTARLRTIAKVLDTSPLTTPFCKKHRVRNKI
jgi:hypothetical protein